MQGQIEPDENTEQGLLENSQSISEFQIVIFNSDKDCMRWIICYWSDNILPAATSRALPKNVQCTSPSMTCKRFNCDDFIIYYCMGTNVLVRLANVACCEANKSLASTTCR